jgi:Spy/CpxP family protein refolding chaperone
MHPGMMHWWRGRQRAAECGTHAGCGPAGYRRFGHEPEAWTYQAAPHRDDASGAFGVRRPLRYLAFKLGLDDEQVARLARILNDVKTERAQADVDGRRTLTAFADAVMGGTFDEQRAADGAALRVRSAEQLRDAVVKSLREIHAVLRPEQRERLAYLIRTGSLTL